MLEPLVTVVTISFNLVKGGRENYVRQAIDCVQNQTYKNIEHIIVDGASADGTLEIFKEYPHLKVYSEPDKGIYDAMNKGAALASGKYVVFLNSDDFWHDNRAVEISVKALEESNADFSYAPCKYLDKNDELLGYLYPSIESFFVWMPFCHQTMFTRTELVKFDTNYKSSGDYDFVLNLILNGAKGVYVPLNFTSYRFIGMSSGIDDQYGNEGGSLSYIECRNSIRCYLNKRYSVGNKVADSINNSKSIKRDLLRKIISDIEPELAELISNRYLAQKGNRIDIDLISKPRKVQILFNARDLNSVQSEKIINDILKHKDCRVVLYKESDVIIPEQFKHFTLYDGRLIDIDAFCSPVSPVPSIIKNSNIKLYESEKDLVYHENKDIKNIYIKGKYKIKFGNFTLFGVEVNHGIVKYKLFKLIPVWKTDICKNSKKYYLFNFFKIFEIKI